MVDKIAQVQCLNKDGYWMKRSLFLNICDLPNNWHKHFLERLKDVPDSYTTVREVHYD